MFSEFVNAAMSRARFEKIKDRQPYYGEIPECKGVWATGKTLAECKKNLREVLEGWIFVRISKGMPVPSVQGKTIAIIDGPVPA